jgi:transposase-like protein
LIVTDKLRSYGVAKCEVLPNVEHRQSRSLTDVFDKTFLAGGVIFSLHG